MWQQKQTRGGALVRGMNYSAVLLQGEPVARVQMATGWLMTKMLPCLWNTESTPHVAFSDWNTESTPHMAFMIGTRRVHPMWPSWLEHGEYTPCGLHDWNTESTPHVAFSDLISLVWYVGFVWSVFGIYPIWCSLAFSGLWFGACTDFKSSRPLKHNSKIFLASLSLSGVPRDIEGGWGIWRLSWCQSTSTVSLDIQ